MNQWAVSSLLLGFHIMQGLLVGLKASPHQHRRHKNQPTTTTTMTTTTKTNSTDRPPYLHTPLPSVLERRKDIKKFLPRKRNLKVKRLMRKMGKDFDSFWMSHETPKNYLDVLTKRNVDSSLEPELRTLDLPSITRKMVTVLDSSSALRGNNSNNSNLYSDDKARVMNGMLNDLEHWLVEMGSCPVYYKWEDLGLLYWPRFVRWGACSLHDEGRKNPLFPTTTSSRPHPSSSCSWPPGMHCVPGKEKRLRLLKWTCKIRGSSLSSSKSNTPTTVAPKTQVPTKTVSHKVDKSDRNRFQFDVLKEINSLDQDETRPDEMEDSFQSMSDLRQFLVENSDLVDTNSEENHGKRSPVVTQREEMRNSNRRLPVEFPPDLSEKKFTSTGKRQEEILGNSLSRSARAARPRRDAGQKRKTDRHGKGRRRGRRRKGGMRCRWVKTTFPVVQDCFCSC